MLNEKIRIGAYIGIHKEKVGTETLTILGEISAVRRHWNGNPDLLEIQVEGLMEWISLEDAQWSIIESIGANNCE
jgi:hypothetical protein